MDYTIYTYVYIVCIYIYIYIYIYTHHIFFCPYDLLFPDAIHPILIRLARRETSGGANISWRRKNVTPLADLKPWPFRRNDGLVLPFSQHGDLPQLCYMMLVCQRVALRLAHVYLTVKSIHHCQIIIRDHRSKIGDVPWLY